MVEEVRGVAGEGLVIEFLGVAARGVAHADGGGCDPEGVDVAAGRGDVVGCADGEEAAEEDDDGFGV